MGKRAKTKVWSLVASYRGLKTGLSRKCAEDAPLTITLWLFVVPSLWFTNAEVALGASGHTPSVVWWAFRPLDASLVSMSGRVPEDQASKPLHVVIDALLAQKRNLMKIPRNEEAERQVWLRRLCLNLTGLPPTFEEMQRFSRDQHPDAAAKWVDRLLASPAYGEHVARQWLDVVRYAESGGFENDRFRPDFWRYRDYVIRVINQDLSFDRQMKEQIAGDVLEPNNPEMLAALGFLAAGPHNDVNTISALEKAKSRQDELDDIVSVLGTTFLGLTVGCARCHDHKEDPISTRDYYALTAIFSGMERATLTFAPPAERNRRQKEWIKADNRVQSTKNAVGELLENARKRWRLTNTKTPSDDELLEFFTPSEQALFDDLVTALAHAEAERRAVPTLPVIYSVRDRQPQPTYVLERGDIQARGERVEPAVPEWFHIPQNPTLVTAATHGSNPRFSASTSPRLALAEWLAHPSNPLPARVMVNRIWQGHFGTGIVATPNDFGKSGALPAHPELLDTLAKDFRDGGWHIKRLHQQIALTATYRLSSGFRGAGAARDPQNRWLGRFSARRLNAEEVRDAILQASGRLDRRMGGPSARHFRYRDGMMPEYLPLEHQGPDTWRRAIYLAHARTFRDPLLAAFDQPDPSLSTPERDETTTAPQVLTLMNNPLVFDQADLLADRARESLGARASHANLVTEVYRLVLSRDPTPREGQRAVAFVEKHELPSLCRILLNGNEFLYVD